MKYLWFYLAALLWVGNESNRASAVTQDDLPLLGQWPGYRRGMASAIALADHYAYVVAGDLQIIDIADRQDGLLIFGLPPNYARWLPSQVKVDAAGYQVTLQASAGSTVVLQRSLNLQTWEDWLSVTATGIPQTFVDSSSGSTPCRFYRAMIVKSPNSDGLDLLQRYPTSLTAGDANPGNARLWEFTEADIYRLTAFNLQVGQALKVETGPADVGIGHCVDGAVWAVVIPRSGGQLTDQANQRTEAISHIWLRFHPAEIARVFPPDTVYAGGDKTLAAQISLIANAKIRSSWHAGLNAMIPEPKDMTVDVDTQDGLRRFFVVDTQAQTAEYVAAFEQQAVQPPPGITPALAEAAFDQLWQAFDRDYAMFVLRPEVDWQQLRNQYRSLALASQSTYEFAGFCAEMLKPLRDLHVWLTVAEAYVPVYDRPRPANANPNAFRSIVGELTAAGSTLQWAITSNQVGFIAINKWTDESVAIEFDEILEHMKGTRGLVIDVRLNGGGSEPLAKQVAARFLDREVTYSYSQYRNGPLHTDLTAKSPRLAGPAGAWRYDRPVVVLIGQRCMSSSESFVAMMAEAPQVVTLGDRTAGSSGNPKTISLPLEIKVGLPQWIDYLADGEPLDERGIVPDVPFTAANANAFQGERDDLLSAALLRLKDAPLPQEPGTTEPEPTVSEIRLTDNRVYTSVTLDETQFLLRTKYGILDIPTEDLIRLSFASATGKDQAATIEFVAVGEIVIDTINGRTPAESISFHKEEIAEIVFGLPAPLAARTNNPARILWYASNNSPESIHEVGFFGYSEAAKIAESLGAANQEVYQNTIITPALLSSYGVVIFMNMENPRTLAADEKAALRDFLAAGGALLVIGQQDSGFPLSREAIFANSITLAYGIEFTTGSANTTTSLAQHALTEGLTSVPGGGSVLKVASPAESLAPKGATLSVLAVSSHGAGRIVAISDDAAFADLSLDEQWGNAAGARLYVSNILRWLLESKPQSPSTADPSNDPLAPPRIVASIPPIGATEVDPALTQISVTFDRDMAPGFSWTGGGTDYPPGRPGEIARWVDKRTCVLPVTLEAARYYRVGINSKSAQNFRSVADVPASPAAIYFTTLGASEELKLKVIKPQVSECNPPNGAKDVDPGLTELRVTFNIPMGRGYSWMSDGIHYPTIPAGRLPYWTADGKTCVLPVVLEPSREYVVGLNGESAKNFQSASGVPLEPVTYKFSTRP